MKHLLLDTTAGVTTVTLNRPDVRNAFNDEVIAELTAVFLELGKRPEVRCVVLAGSGCRCSMRRRGRPEHSCTTAPGASRRATTSCRMCPCSRR